MQFTDLLLHSLKKVLSPLPLSIPRFQNWDNSTITLLEDEEASEAWAPKELCLTNEDHLVCFSAPLCCWERLRQSTALVPWSALTLFLTKGHSWTLINKTVQISQAHLCYISDNQVIRLIIHVTPF